MARCLKKSHTTPGSGSASLSCQHGISPVQAWVRTRQGLICPWPSYLPSFKRAKLGLEPLSCSDGRQPSELLILTRAEIRAGVWSSSRCPQPTAECLAPAGHRDAWCWSLAQPRSTGATWRLNQKMGAVSFSHSKTNTNCVKSQEKATHDYYTISNFSFEEKNTVIEYSCH